MATPNIVALTVLVSDSYNAHSPEGLVNEYVEPRLPSVFHTRLPDPIDAMSLRPQKTDLKVLDPAKLL